MAQTTGQASRQRTGTDKASGKKTGARSRARASSRNGSSSGTSGRAGAGRAKPKSAGSSGSSNGRGGSRSSRQSKGSSTRRTKRRPTSKPTLAKRLAEATRSAVETVSPIAAKVPQAAQKAPKLARKAPEVARKVPKVAERVPRAAKRARPAALPVGTAGAGLAAAGLARQALRSKELRKRLSDISLPQPHLPGAPELSRQDAVWLLALPAGLEATRRLGRARRIPIQQCVDVAVPVQVAYDEWMRLDFLPEGARDVRDIERGQDGRLTGRLTRGLWPRKWEAEILDERDCESFAWRSDKGSDCAGLITFHSLGERLTRLELQLDIVPLRPLEGLEFALRIADSRARNDLRRFKARLETINPDAYGTDEEPTGEGNDDR